MRTTKPLHWAAAVLAAVVTTAGGVSQPAAASDPRAPVESYIGPLYSVNSFNAGTPRAMAVLNASATSGARLIQYSYNSAAPYNDIMLVEYENTTANLVRIKPWHTYSDNGNVHDDKCLAVLNNASGSNAAIVSQNCTYDSVNNDVWERFQNAAKTAAVFRRQNSNQCITVQNNSIANNAALITFTCNGSANQSWAYGSV